jgi:hypothetical protein
MMAKCLRCGAGSEWIEGNRRVKPEPEPEMDKLHDPVLTPILFAILVKRLGGRAEITQADIDDIAFSRLEEEGREGGSLEFRLVYRRCAS